MFGTQVDTIQQHQVDNTADDQTRISNTFRTTQANILKVE